MDRPLMAFECVSTSNTANKTALVLAETAQRVLGEVSGSYFRIAASTCRLTT